MDWIDSNRGFATDGNMLTRDVTFATCVLVSRGTRVFVNKKVSSPNLKSHRNLMRCLNTFGSGALVESACKR